MRNKKSQKLEKVKSEKIETMVIGRNYRQRLRARYVVFFDRKFKEINEKKTLKNPNRRFFILKLLNEMLRQCPFDPVHVFQANRYQQHILSCRKIQKKRSKTRIRKNRPEMTGSISLLLRMLFHDFCNFSIIHHTGPLEIERHYCNPECSPLYK